ncbi:hypothetical protein ACQEUX_11140 [Micromonospora sp. CA-259024]|uniref:hypothetical protein n=1 Tax=Micromonospora sp. CA-259024 TaxID=3239965 RepID=UPI003D90696D
MDYVLGPGIQDFQVPLGNRQRRIDMLFPLTATRALIVEYDGAHWHQSREGSDWEKSRAMSDGWGQYRDNAVVRIREHPLEPLGHLDVGVPPRPGPLICTRLTLFHLLHTCPYVSGERVTRIVDFLRTSPRPLARDEVSCGGCWSEATYVMPPDLLVPTLRRQRRRADPVTERTVEQADTVPPRGFQADIQQEIPGL